jgi:methylated-DNA-[protein]-cysteine S-methyltransferase
MPSTFHHAEFETPVGRITIQGDGHCITGLYLPDHKGWRGPAASSQTSSDAFSDAWQQLAEYFAGVRRRFDLLLRPEGTPFQQRVWAELTRIPFGETITYGELARRVGQPTAIRAVGAANARNPISILIPCHRVIGASGTLTGYAGGLERKRWLLELEGVAVQTART